MVEDGKPPPPPEGETRALQNHRKFPKQNLYTYIMKSFNLQDYSTVPPSGGGGGMEILVFKTSLTNTSHISKVRSTLNLHPQIREWNVDLNDCDNILRIVSDKISATEVEALIKSAGHFCEELN